MWIVWPWGLLVSEQGWEIMVASSPVARRGPELWFLWLLGLACYWLQSGGGRGLWERECAGGGRELCLQSIFHLTSHIE